MFVETTAPFRRVVGTLIRGVGSGLVAGAEGIPLAGAKVVAEASIRSGASDHFIAFDPVEGITDNNAVLRNAITGEPGLLLVVTDDPSVGVVDWTWHITITAPTLRRPIEFDLPVPSGDDDLNIKDLDPVPGSGGEVVYMWRDAISAAASKAVDVSASAVLRPALNKALGGSRRVRIALTLPGGSSFRDARTSVAQRLPIFLPADSLRWRIHLRNANYRDTSTQAGALSMRPIFFGRNRVDSFGQITGQWREAPVQVAPAFTHSGSAEFISEWITDADRQIRGRTEYMLGYGYTSPVQQNHQLLGGGWTSNNAADVESMSASMTEAKFAPLDIWLEVEVAASVPIWAFFGDSICVGSSARFPIRDSTYQKFAIANGAMPMLVAQHGSTMAMWADATAGKWTTWLGGVSKPDAVLWQLGSNDIFNGESLATCQARFNALLSIVRDKLSPTIYLATITARNGSATDPAKEAVRQSYNDWLYQLPGGAVATFATAEAIEAPGGGTTRAAFMSPDDVHPNSAGYAKIMTALSPIAAPSKPAYDPRSPLHSIPVPGATRWVAGRMLGTPGETVDEWADVAGGNRLVPVAGWDRPVLGEDEGGRRCVSARGRSAGLQVTLARAQPYTVVVVARVHSTPSGSGVLVGGGGGSARGALFINSSGNLTVNAGTSLTVSQPSSGVTVYTGRFDSGASVAAVNGVERSGNAGTENASVLTVGRYSVADSGADADFYEVLFWPFALNGAQRASVVAALSAVYGL